MVSLRVVREQQANEQRKQRLLTTRRLSAQIGVESARRYEEQKRQQDAAVKDALHRQWELEQGAQRAFMQRVVAEGTMRQGEGMRNASARAEHMHRRCSDEAAAWEAEHMLERERYRLALEREQLTMQLRDEKTEAVAKRRAYAKEMEAKRTMALLEKAQRSSSRHMSLASESSPRAHSLPHNKASISLHSVGPGGEGTLKGDEAARQHMERQKALSDQQRAKALEEQRKAAQRAKHVVQEMKMQEEQRRLEEEHEAMLKESMTANAMRSALRPISATDFQEQEARKAQAAQKKTEAEFEKLFLHGAWSIDTIERLHDAPQAPQTSSGAFLAPCSDEDRSTLVETSVPLHVAGLAVSEVVDADEPDVKIPEGMGDGRAQNAYGGLNESLNDIAPDPQPSESLPQPTPKTPSPPQPDREADATDSPVRGVDDLAAASASHASWGAEGTESQLPLSPLRSRQEQFLRDLDALQSRLSRAAQPSMSHSRRKDVDTSGSTQLTAEGDLSISSMSSQELSTRVVCSDDTSQSSQPQATSTGATKKAGYGMTAEQLKSALLRMRNK